MCGGVRTLETLYWLGVREASATAVSGATAWASLGQWEPYALEQSFEQDGLALPKPAEALEVLIRNRFTGPDDDSELIGSTQVCIVPGYRFKLCDGLVTNFHQPDSTLLLLVAALVGREQLMQIYKHAVQEGYMFLSYGDACFLHPKAE